MDEIIPLLDENELAEKQKKALPFFLGAENIEQACKEAKISKGTYYEWLKDAAFKSELSRLRNNIVEDAVETLKSHTTKAVDVLVRLLDSTNPALQRGVANDILQHVTKFKELQELEKRLEVLETASKEENNESFKHRK